jgi:hypothetical protein
VGVAGNHASRRTRRKLAIDPRKEAQRAVDEFRRQGAIAWLELNASRKLRLENRRRKRLILLNPRENLRSDLTRASTHFEPVRDVRGTLSRR